MPSQAPRLPSCLNCSEWHFLSDDVIGTICNNDHVSIKINLKRVRMTRSIAEVLSRLFIVSIWNLNWSLKTGRRKEPRTTRQCLCGPSVFLLLLYFHGSFCKTSSLLLNAEVWALCIYGIQSTERPEKILHWERLLFQNIPCFPHRIQMLHEFWDCVLWDNTSTSDILSKRQW